MCNKFAVKAKANSAGISLIELLLFIVIVGVGVSGVLAAFRLSVQKSADPLVRKQVVVIAESLLEEVELMPFSYCDPDDANALTATSATVGAGGCATTVEGLGPEAGESRYATGGLQFDNVSDYHGYNSATETPSGIKDVSGTAIPVLTGYNASVTVSSTALGSIPAGGSFATSDALLIAVTVTGPGNTAVTLHGYRARYAPRSTP
ncbi:MAG: type II secretion system protein [Pseudomonadota bacterium]